MTDALATAVYEEIYDRQSSVSPTQSASGKLKLSVENLKSKLSRLSIGEKSLKRPSVAESAGFKETNLSEVSSIKVQGDSPNTLLEVGLKPEKGQQKEYLGRANLDAMMDTINIELGEFLNAPRPP